MGTQTAQNLGTQNAIGISEPALYSGTPGLLHQDRVGPGYPL
jgi:hypothetical protein